MALKLTLGQVILTGSDRVGKWSLNSSPREWQQRALEKWKTARRGVVSVVTGGGKTFFAQMCMLSFRQQSPEGIVVIVVPTTALLDQWYVSLQEDLGVHSSDIACFSGEERADRPAAVNLAVLNTARETAPAISELHDTFLIVDECHRAGSPVNARALQGTHSATLGLSATPEREYDEGFAELVKPALGDIIYQYDYVAASADQVISPFDLVNVRVDLLPDEQEEYKRVTRLITREAAKNRDHEQAEERIKRLLQRRAAVSAAATMRIPVAAKLVDMHRGQRTIVFHERVEKANGLQRILSNRGHNTALYHSGIGPAVRRDNLRLYRRGLFDVLISCRALDEGMNVPETVVAIIASSTASLRQRVQRLGRVLRPAAGKEAATIYTIYATDQEEQRLVAEAERLKDVASVTWQRGKASRHGEDTV